MTPHLHLQLRRRLAAACAALSCIVLACEPGTRGVRVLVAGAETRDGTSVAMLWDDDQEIPLDEEHPSYTSGIAVAGNDVYVSGSVLYGDAVEAVYWKNGEVVRLTDGTQESFATAIAVADGSVYVVGGEGLRAMLWRDGEATPLTSGALHATARAIAVSDGKVHVAGFEDEDVEVQPGIFERRTVAKLWVDGVPRSLDSGDAPYAMCSGVAVSGAEVYVSGVTDAYRYPDEWSVAMVWAGDTRQPITDGSRRASAEAIALAGSDVIVAGHLFDGTMNAPALWKNGVQQELAYDAPGSVKAVATYGRDVYAAGEVGGVGMLWVNGHGQPLGEGNNPAYASALAVQPR